MISIFGNSNIVYATEDDFNDGSSQSVSISYTKTITNEYSVVIPTSLNLNETTEMNVSLSEDSVISDDFSVHVDIDKSSFNGDSRNIYLYAENSDTEYMSVRPFQNDSRGSRFLQLGATADKNDLTVAIFYNDTSKNIGGTLELVTFDDDSNYATTTTKYVGSILFDIYLQYEN